MLPISLDDLTFDKLEALVGAGVREGRTLDFKRDPVGPKDDDKREFLADVSAFANTAGGDLVFGVDEAAGEATGVPGIALEDPDKEVNRLDAVLRSGLEPRLPNVRLHWVRGPEGRVALVVRTVRSFAAPHRVTFRDHSKFYARNSSGKYALDVSELRAAFLSAEGLLHSIRRFRDERLAVIEANEGPVPVVGGAKLVFHLLPLSSFAAPQQVEIDERRLLAPLGLPGSYGNLRHVLEGLATYRGEEAPDAPRGYTLLFRTGAIEGVCSVEVPSRHNPDQQGPAVYPDLIEDSLIRCYDQWRAELLHLGIEPPYYAFASLLGIRGRVLLSNVGFTRRVSPLRRDAALLPEIVVTDARLGGEEVLRPAFDQVWQTFGWPKSGNFNAEGKYTGHVFR